jgi:hypothetical protein
MHVMAGLWIGRNERKAKMWPLAARFNPISGSQRPRLQANCGRGGNPSSIMRRVRRGDTTS